MPVPGVGEISLLSGGGTDYSGLHSALLAVKVWSSGAAAYVWSGDGLAPDPLSFTQILFVDPAGTHDPTTSPGGRTNVNDLWETGTPFPPAGTYVTATGGGRETVNTQATASGAVTLDLSLGNVQSVTLTGNVTSLTVSNTVAGKSCTFTLVVKQDGTGSRTWTWMTGAKWGGGTVPTITSAANKIDVFTFMTVDNGTTWYGFTAGQNVVTTSSFSYTGAAQTFTVPAGVTSISVSVVGAAGGTAVFQNHVVDILGGQGSTVTGTITVTPAQVLQINVGGKPSGTGATGGNGGFNGGGTATWDGVNSWGGGGGGASDIRQGAYALADRVVAAGAGGGGAVVTGVTGGNGALNGAAGSGAAAGGGGTQSAGGAAGAGAGGAATGTLGVGGSTTTGTGNTRPGAGGGGYWGGGAGDSTNSAGGGGSSLVPAGGAATTGGNTGNGSIVLTYTAGAAGVTGVTMFRR